MFVELPETVQYPLGEDPRAQNFTAERGDEVKPLGQLPDIPNPNDFVGSAMFQVHAIGKVGTADKPWVKITGIIVFSVALLGPLEVALLFRWVNAGNWVPFVFFNTGVLALWRWRKNAKRKIEQRLKKTG